MCNTGIQPGLERKSVLYLKASEGTVEHINTITNLIKL